MQNNPRTEFERRRACLAIKHDAMVSARGYWDRSAFVSAPGPAAPTASHPLHRRPLGTQQRPEIESPNSWFLQNANNSQGCSRWRTPYFYPQAELLPRDCTASGSQDGHPQGLMGETTGTFLWSHVGEKGRNTDGAAKLQCSMCKEIGGCAWGQKRGLPGVVPNICFLLLGPFAQGQES